MIRMVIFLITSLGLLASVRAEEPSDDSPHRQRARALLDEGNALFAQEKYELALQRYEAAYRAYPSSKIFLNQAEAHRALGQPDRAVLFYERFLSQADAAAVEATRVRVESRLAELESQIGRIRPVVEPPQASVRIDDRPIIAPKDSIPVLPGRHRVTASLEGYTTVLRTVEVAAGQTETVSLKLVLLEMETPEPDSFSLSNVPWWVWAGVGALAITGTIVGVATLGGGDDFVPGGELGRSGTSGWERL